MNEMKEMCIGPSCVKCSLAILREEVHGGVVQLKCFSTGAGREVGIEPADKAALDAARKTPYSYSETVCKDPNGPQWE